MRGDTFRPPTKSSHPNPEFNVANNGRKALELQMFALHSIYEFIIKPYIDKGYAIHITGMIYRCPKNKLIKKFFSEKKLASLNIQEISRIGSMQIETFRKGIEYAYSLHPTSDFFVVLRSDQTFLKSVPLSSTDINKISFPNANFATNGPAADQIHIIGKNSMPQLRNALSKTNRSDLHDIHQFIDLKYKCALFPDDPLPGNSAARAKKSIIPDTSPFYIDLQRSRQEEIYRQKICSLAKILNLPNPS